MQTYYLSEPTEAQQQCQHDKAYSSDVLTTDPPQHCWICRNCGLQGRDMADPLPRNDYRDVVERFTCKDPV